jgi:hypothetical protein
MASYQITAPTGEQYQIDAPDSATSDEVIAFAQQNHIQQAPAEPRFMQRESNDISSRYNDFMNIANNPNAQTGFSNTLQQTGDIVGLGTDLVGNAVGSYARSVRDAYPETAKSVIGAVQDAGNYIADSQVGNLLKQGVQTAQQYPEITKDLGAVGNIAGILPFVKPAGVVIDSIGSLASDAGSGIREIVQPNRSANNAINDVLKANINNLPYQAQAGTLMNDIRTQGAASKDAAVSLRNSAEQNMTGSTIKKPLIDNIMSDVNDALQTFDSSDANTTVSNIMKNINAGTTKGGTVISPELAQQNAMRTSLGLKAIEAPTEPDQIDIQSLFNAKKALSKQKNIIGAKSAAAGKASEIIDNHINSWIDDKVLSGDIQALQDFKQSTPMFAKYYSTYEKSPSSIFNNVIKKPDKYSPDGFFNAVFAKSLSGTDAGVNTINQVKKTLGENGVIKLKEGLNDAILTKSTKNGKIDYKEMNKYLNNVLSNKSFSQALLKPQEIQQYRILKDELVKNINKKQNSLLQNKTFKLITKAALGGAVGTEVYRHL